MDSLSDVYTQGSTYDEMVSAASQNADLYRISGARAVAPEEFAARVAATGRHWHLLTVSEDWCGDSVNTLPWLEALAGASPHLDHRIIRRDEHLGLMDAHLTNGRTRSIPIVLLLDDHFVERAWWGPRPRDLQRWFESDEAQAMTKDERYKILRTRYVRDRGHAIMNEIVTMIEAAAGQGSIGGSPSMQAASQA